MKRWLVAFAMGVVGLSLSVARAEVALDANSSVDQVLDALDARGQGLKDFTADLSMGETDEFTGDTITNSGRFWYQNKGGGDSRARLIFDKRQVVDRVDNNARREFILDNGMLIELDYKRKLEVDRQVLRPGQKMNLIKLGEGPFPLPVGQPKEEVKKLFEVTKVAAAKEDPAGTTHIALVPRAGTQFVRKFKRIDVFVDNTTHFPLRIDTLDRNGVTRRKTMLTHIKVNAGVTDKDFEVPKVEGWQKKTEMLAD